MKLAILAGCAAVAFALGGPEPCQIANSVIIDGDPLQAVFNLTHVALVVKEVRVVSDHGGQHH